MKAYITAILVTFGLSLAMIGTFIWYVSNILR